MCMLRAVSLPALICAVCALLGAGPGHHAGPDRAGPGIYDCCCLLGYCLLPMLAHALLSLLIPKNPPPHRFHLLHSKPVSASRQARMATVTE